MEKLKGMIPWRDWCQGCLCTSFALTRPLGRDFHILGDFSTIVQIMFLRTSHLSRRKSMYHIWWKRKDKTSQHMPIFFLLHLMIYLAIINISDISIFSPILTRSGPSKPSPFNQVIYLVAQVNDCVLDFPLLPERHGSAMLDPDCVFGFHQFAQKFSWNKSFLWMPMPASRPNHPPPNNVPSHHHSLP